MYLYFYPYARFRYLFSNSLTATRIVFIVQRLCHDGSLDIHFVPPVQKPAYRIFDRVMFLNPKDDTSPIICPSGERGEKDTFIQSSQCLLTLSLYLLLLLLF